MTNYDSFTREEMDTLCGWVGEKNIKACFTRAPRELFRIIHRDCMVKKLTMEQVCGIIYQNRSDSFIAFILEPGLEQLFGILKNRTVQIEASGAESTEALVRALAESPFSENVPLYFKLQDDSFSEEYIRMTTAAVAIAVKQYGYATIPDPTTANSVVDDQQHIADLEQQIDELRAVADQYPSQIAELEQQIRELRSESEQIESELSVYREREKALQRTEYSISYEDPEYQHLSC